MHCIRGESSELNPVVVLYDVTIKTVIVPHLLHVRVLKVLFEDFPNSIAAAHGIHPKQAAFALAIGSKIYIRTTKHGKARHLTVADGCLVGNFDVRHFCIARMV